MFLNKRRRKPAPPFLEGTFGTYVRRESPPRIPRSTPTVKPSQSTKSITQNVSKTASTSNIDSSNTNLDQHQLTTHSLGTQPRVQQQQQHQKSLRPTHPLSSHSFSDPSKSAYVQKKVQQLTTSLSIGNFDQYGEDPNHGFELLQHQEIPKRAISGGSLQSISGRMPGSSILDDSISVGTPESELPLPRNWGVEVTQDGFRYYVDHNNQRTHWIHPLAMENLPPGWTKIFDTNHGVVYYNEIEKRSQFEHPGLATPLPNLATIRESSSLQSLVDEEPPNEVEDLNIIKEEIPSWLQMYSMA
uniref:WW domain-containing protein n=1 Tax=Acrobeloides nanus TaxID=290746 RepID=A0A914DD73_9BILA